MLILQRLQLSKRGGCFCKRNLKKKNLIFSFVTHLIPPNKFDEKIQLGEISLIAETNRLLVVASNRLTTTVESNRIGCEINEWFDSSGYWTPTEEKKRSVHVLENNACFCCSILQHMYMLNSLEAKPPHKLLVFGRKFLQGTSLISRAESYTPRLGMLLDFHVNIIQCCHVGIISITTFTSISSSVTRLADS